MESLVFEYMHFWEITLTAAAAAASSSSSSASSSPSAADRSGDAPGAATNF